VRGEEDGAAALGVAGLGELAGQLRHFVQASAATEGGLDLHGEAARPGQQDMVDIAVSEPYPSPRPGSLPHPVSTRP
jgi:hypothetical protein